MQILGCYKVFRVEGTSEQVLVSIFIGLTSTSSPQIDLYLALHLKSNPRNSWQFELVIHLLVEQGQVPPYESFSLQ